MAEDKKNEQNENEQNENELNDEELNRAAGGVHVFQINCKDCNHLFTPMHGEIFCENCAGKHIPQGKVAPHIELLKE